MNDWSQDVETICQEYNICPQLVEAMIYVESSGNPDAVNGNCVGLMQINPNCHKDRMQRLGVTDLYDGYSNILVGVDYLAELAQEYEDLPLVLDIYNGNSKAFENYENDVISPYAKKVMTLSEQYERQIDGQIFGTLARG